jgi:hypothetical protein
VQTRQVIATLIAYDIDLLGLGRSCRAPASGQQFAILARRQPMGCPTSANAQ